MNLVEVLGLFSSSTSALLEQQSAGSKGSFIILFFICLLLQKIGPPILETEELHVTWGKGAGNAKSQLTSLLWLN